MSLESNKSLAGVGALLVAIGSVFPVLSLVGIILVLVSMKGFAEHYKDESIFTDTLYGFISGVGGFIAAIILFIGILVSYIRRISLTTPVAPSGLGVAAFIVILVIAFVFLLVQAVFYKRAFDKLAAKTGEDMFRTAGLLLLIGSVLTIIFVGFILLFVAWILIAIAFFSVKIEATKFQEPVFQSQTPASIEKRYCPYCGAENEADSLYCSRCGRKLKP
jgi:uncharacterized membrane protein